MELEYFNYYSVIGSDVFYKNEVEQVKGIYFNENKNDWFLKLYHNDNHIRISDVKLILSDLKNLNKPYPGAPGLIPLDFILKNLDNNFNINDLDNINRKTYDFLLRYNFDIFGLIGKGLAIDINTL